MITIRHRHKVAVQLFPTTPTPRRLEKPMTVAIAAICNIGKDPGPIIVTASDRMITIGDIEYEPAQTKVITFATRTVALFAGDMGALAIIMSAL
jgi:hypothetical protein